MVKGRRIWILAVVIAILAAMLSASLVLADPPDPDGDEPPAGDGDGFFYGPRMGRGHHYGMWGGGVGPMGGGYGFGMRGGGYGGGWMAEYQDEMHAAVAEALGLSVEEFDAAMAEGQTMWQIAEEQGVDPEDVRDAMQVVREDIINQAVEDGVITQEQADWMLGQTMPDYDEEGTFRRGPRRGRMGCW